MQRVQYVDMGKGLLNGYRLLKWVQDFGIGTGIAMVKVFGKGTGHTYGYKM